MTNTPYYEPMELIKTLVSDREALLSRLLGETARCKKAAAGLARASETLLTNDSEENTRKMLNTTMRDLAKQYELNLLLLSVVIMLCSSNDFTGWQASFAMKTGANPQDVLRQMMKDKMTGKS